MFAEVVSLYSNTCIPEGLLVHTDQLWIDSGKTKNLYSYWVIDNNF